MDSSRRRFLQALSAGGAWTALAGARSRPTPAGKAGQRPNVVFILADDLGWPALSSYGNGDVATPHLDRLGREGIRFAAAYAAPQCTATRATLLTGQYTARNRMWHVLPRYGYPFARVREPEFAENLPRTTPTVARALHDGGYATACIGKWHLHSNTDGDYERLYPENAAAYGFDRVFPDREHASCGGGGDECVDLLTDQALRFIEENRARPFFLYLAHYSIHDEVFAPADLVAKYRALGYPESGLKHATYLAAIEHLDSSVGRVLAKLATLGLDERTVVIFMSDNGGVADEFPNAPLRAGKGTLYEGGIRVSFLMRGPGQIVDGRTSATPVHAVDLYPTLLELTGCARPVSHVLDGQSLAPLLRGGKLRREAIFTYAPLYDWRWGATPAAAIRQGRFKLIESFGDYVDLARGGAYVPEARVELFDLSHDLGEREDLSRRMPERVRVMRARLHAWITGTGAIIPGQNPGFDPGRALEEVLAAR
jgi:uncharacterized sulfatase